MQDETAMAPPTYTPNVSWCALCGALVAHLRPRRIPLELDTLTPHTCGIRPPKARRRKRRGERCRNPRKTALDACSRAAVKHPTVWSHGTDSNRRPAVYEFVSARPSGVGVSLPVLHSLRVMLAGETL